MIKSFIAKSGVTFTQGLTVIKDAAGIVDVTASSSEVAIGVVQFPAANTSVVGDGTLTVPVALLGDGSCEVFMKAAGTIEAGDYVSPHATTDGQVIAKPAAGLTYGVALEGATNTELFRVAPCIFNDALA